MATDRPSLVFILPDQCGAVALGAYGNRDVQTPNLDRLAQESVVFDCAYTPSPVCTPFRGTLFTGRYPTQTGVARNGYRIPEDEITLARLFREDGYHTAYVGKWHLSGPPGGNQWVSPHLRSGFETFVGWESNHVDHWQGRIWDDGGEPLTMPGHETDALTDIALDVMGLLEPPFCLFIAFQAPHPPCAPPEQFLEPYEGGSLAYRPNVDEGVWCDRPGWNADYGLRTFTDRYYGEISHLDAAVGRLLSQLASDDRQDDTVVVFSSDHGEMMGSHGLYGKGVMYEEALRIPLIVRPPSGTLGRRTDALVSSVDFLPTLLGLCGLPSAASVEGTSYAPLIRGEDQTTRDAVFAEYGDQLCIRTGTEKLVVDRTTEQPTALYDLHADPFEQTNLVGDPAHSIRGEELRQALVSWFYDVQQRPSEHRGAASQPYPVPAP